MKKFLGTFICAIAIILCFTCLSGCGEQEPTSPPVPDTLSFNTLSAEGTEIRGKVSNDVKTFSFINEITVTGNTKFVVSQDIYGQQQITTKTIPLAVGDNTVYVIKMLNDEPVNVYTVTIRRRPMYIVTFNTNGGTSVEVQEVEEDSHITAPTTTKVGYDFISWDYDFTKPITQNKTINANWVAHTDTPYKAEYYFENLEDENYTLKETVSLSGTTDTIATIDVEEFDHFTYVKDLSVTSNNINADGSTVLKLYYSRNTYTISNDNTTGGELSIVGTYKYGTPLSITATTYLGYDFCGWSNGEIIISAQNTYSTELQSNILANFTIKEEMENFEFTSTATTCKIASIKDATITSIVIPDCVTSIGKYAFDDCSSLESITIPNSVTSIGSSAFYSCSNLTIYCEATSKPSGWSSSWNNSNRPVYWSSVMIDGIGYQINGDNATICRQPSNIKVANIPSSIIYKGNTYSVTSIGSSAFYDCRSLAEIVVDENNPNYSSLDGNLYDKNKTTLIQYAIGKTTTSFVIPNSVTNIGHGAFKYCDSLESITIGNSVTSIGNYTFDWCSRLESITIPNSVTSIGYYAFNGCSSLEKVNYLGTIDDWVQIDFTDVSSNPLYYAENLYINDELVVHANITNATKINSYAFYNCSSLESTTIPNSVTSIGVSAFNGCRSLEKVNYLGTIDDWVQIDFTDVSSNPLYYAENLYINDELVVHANITNATRINSCAFYNCSSLESTTIPNSVTSIGDYAFDECDNLTGVTIPNSVTSIGDYAFDECDSLSIYCEATSKPSGWSSYWNYSNRPVYWSSIIVDDIRYKLNGENATVARPLSNIKVANIPSSITYNGKIYSVTSIGSSAFNGCSSLESVTIPNSVTSIESGAFNGCSSLESITIPNSVTRIGGNAFNGCSSLTSVTIPNSVTNISNYAFSGCSSLTSVTIPNSVTSIGDGAFYNCSSLESVTIPNSVTSIKANAFYNCSSLESVTIPNSVTSIGNYAFDGCDSLSIYCEATSKPSGWSSSWNYSNRPVYWNIVMIDGIGYQIGDNATICRQPSNIKVANIPSSITYNGKIYSVTSIGSSAFYNCSSLESTTIPNSVTSIGRSAFYNCNSLISITIPNSVTSIGDYTFYNCSSLESVTIPNSVTSIGANAFNGCSSVESVTIGNGVTSIDSGAFYNCSSLESVTIPNSVTSIGRSAFYNCSRLTSVTISNSVTSIGNYAFDGCDSLTIYCETSSAPSGWDSSWNSDNRPVVWNSVMIDGIGYQINGDNATICRQPSNIKVANIPNSITYNGKTYNVTSIGDRAFSGCSSLISITIPNSVTSIGYVAFLGCSSLAEIVVDENNPNYSSLDGNLYDKNKTTLIQYAIGKTATSFVIPNSATSIGDGAFWVCKSLTSVTIGNSVTSIGDDAFYNCSSLEKVNYLGTIDDWVKIDFNSAHSNPLYYAKNLYINDELVVHANITNATIINSCAFYNCSSLESITITNSVTSIGVSAFNGCNSLSIYCEATSKPSGWSSSWNSDNRPVYWGVSLQN